MIESKWIRTLALSTVILSGMYTVDALQEPQAVHANSETVMIDGYEYSKQVVDTLNEINKYRKAVGVEPYKLDPFLTKSAQSHAQYLATHGRGSNGHRQEAGKSGFTGEDFTARAKAFGYTIKGGTESVVTGYSNYKSAVSKVVEGVYHRPSVLHSSYETVGIGIVGGTYVIVADNVDRSNGKAYSYPYPNQKDAPRIFDVNETPDPLAKYGVKKAGYIISYYPGGVLDLYATLDKKHKMYLKDSKGNEVELLNKNNTPDFDGYVMFIIPKEPLKKGETYTVTVEYVPYKSEPKTYSWSFTTEGTPDNTPTPTPTNPSVPSEYKQYYDRFVDFNHNEWWANDMIWAIDRGLINGYPDAKTGKAVLKPYGTLTEAHALTILLRHFHADEFNRTKATSEWVYNTQYQLAKKYNLPTKANESSEASKRVAMEGIRRGTLAQILASIHEGKPVDERTAIDFLMQTGITTAKTHSDFRPDETLTRSQVSAFIQRYVIAKPFRLLQPRLFK